MGKDDRDGFSYLAIWPTALLFSYRSCSAKDLWQEAIRPLFVQCLHFLFSSERGERSLRSPMNLCTKPNQAQTCSGADINHISFETEMIASSKHELCLFWLCCHCIGLPDNGDKVGLNLKKKRLNAPNFDALW